MTSFNSAAVALAANCTRSWHKKENLNRIKLLGDFTIV
jgi:hypothetical protein